MDHSQFLSKNKKVIALFVSLLYLCAGCATVNVPRMGETGYKMQDDERRLMNRAREAIDAIDNSNIFYDDPELEVYLNQILTRLAEEQVAELPPDIDLKVRVINDPTLNAFAFPNGRIFVHTGILAAAESEGQIATLLAHELTHVTHRHVLQQFRSLQNKSAFWGFFGAPLNLVSGGLSSLFTQLTFLSSVSGFSQAVELESDNNAYTLVKKIGYDAGETKKLFEHIKEFTRQEEIRMPYFFSSHPNTLERIKNYETLIKEDTDITEATKTTSPEYAVLMRPLIQVNAAACLSKGFFKTAQRNIDRLIHTYPQDAFGYVLQGDLFRQRQDPRAKEKKRDKNEDYTKALEAYTRALDIDPNNDSAYFGRARVHYQMGNKETAKADFQNYLKLNPNAPDREYIQSMIKTP